MSDELDDIVDEALDDCPIEYPWAADNDERRRCFVFDKFAEDWTLPELAEAVEWLKTGKIPAPVLKAVKS